MLFERLKAHFPAIRQNEPLKNHCTFRVGGPADFFYELRGVEELPKIVKLASEYSIPTIIIGRGSNILFTDKGFRGLIIKNLSRGLLVNGDTVMADSGVLLSEIIRETVKTQGLSGLEPLYGLPGTIGGAIYGNAGVPKTEIGDFVKSVSYFDPFSGIQESSRDEITFGYRTSTFKGSPWMILKVCLKLQRGSTDQSKEMIKTIDAIRRGKQPTGFTCGSFFKNPSPGKPAGYLIDQAGLKGFSVGGAKISEKHANFFMNVGNARTSDILGLADIAKKKVREKFGISLEEEVRIIGDL